MKKFYLVPLLALSFNYGYSQLYSQTFDTDMPTLTNAASADPNYVGNPATGNQFTYLGAPSSGTIGVSGGALHVITSSTGSRWAAVRNSGFASTPTAIMVQFDANFTVGSSGTSASKFQFYVGNGFSNGTTVDANTAIHSGFAIRYQNSSYYYVSTLGGTALTTQYAEGTSRTFTFVTNNSGSAITYTAPDGTTESIGDDKWDLWVGMAKVFDEQTATTATQTLDNFKFGDINGNNGRSDVDIDNLKITDINVGLPLSFTGFSASVKNGQTNIMWSTANEENASKFVVERSSDGRSFSEVGSTPAKNAVGRNAYTFNDVHAISGSNFYRVKAVSKDGSIQYTNIIKLSSARKADIIISPNPVVGNVMNLQTMNLSSGLYIVRMLTEAGVEVVNTTINVNGSSSVQSIHLGGATRGNYLLVLTNGQEVFTRKIIVK